MYTMISKMTQYKKYKTTRKKICMKIQVMKVKNHYKILMTKLWKSVNCKNLKNLNFCNKRIKTKSLRKIYKNSWELRMIKRRCCKVIILVKYNKFPNIIKTKVKIKKDSKNKDSRQRKLGTTPKSDTRITIICLKDKRVWLK